MNGNNLGHISGEGNTEVEGNTGNLEARGRGSSKIKNGVICVLGLTIAILGGKNWVDNKRLGTCIKLLEVYEKRSPGQPSPDELMKQDLDGLVHTRFVNDQSIKIFTKDLAKVQKYMDSYLINLSKFIADFNQNSDSTDKKKVEQFIADYLRISHYAYFWAIVGSRIDGLTTSEIEQWKNQGVDTDEIRKKLKEIKYSHDRIDDFVAGGDRLGIIVRMRLQKGE